MVDSAGVPRASGAFDPYVPRGVLARLTSEDPAGTWAVPGTMVFCDLSGFTRLSERLQRTGREGAELLADAVNGCFAEMLAVADANGGSLVKFGGDALLLFFEGPGHAARACRAALGMRTTLRGRGPVVAGGARVVLRMTVGVHSDTFHFFLVGRSHLECLLVGSAISEVTAVEGAARSGQIVISPSTAAALPAGCAGAAIGPGVLLRRAPDPADGGGEDPSGLEAPGPAAPGLEAPGPAAPGLEAPGPAAPGLEAPGPAAPGLERAGMRRSRSELVARGLSTAVRAHLGDGRQLPEHRLVTVAFLKFSGTDALMAADGPEGVRLALDELVGGVGAATDEFGVCFLGSDVEAGGGKLILCAGAPRVLGDDEERMLLALRQIISATGRIPVRIGVNRGPAFAGEIGTPFRRVYTLMGDTVNLAARLMARAGPSQVWATAGVLEHSPTRFETTALEPFVAKGKALPILAWALGPPRRRQTGPAGGGVPGGPKPLVGRHNEMAALTEALSAAVGHRRGTLVEVVGPAGIGKSRLVDEARDWATTTGMSTLRATCEAYTASVPYAPWGSLLRQVLGLDWTVPPGVVFGRLAAHLAAHDPSLAPSLPLLAAVLDIDAPATPEVDGLAPEFRRAATEDAVLRFLAPAQRRPTLVEIDQAHLMDAASADLLTACTRTLPTSAWVVLVTRRPSPAAPAGAAMPPAPGSGGVSGIELGPLGDAEALFLAETTTETVPLPPHVTSLAVARSGGNPQFLLDLLQIAARGGGSDLPESAGAAAMARLDLLGATDRSLVRRASVLGVEFHRRHLEGVLDPDVGPPTERTWARLGEIFEDRGAQRFRFRSAVVRDAAYANLPFRLRRELHAAAAATLEQCANSDDEGSADPAVLSLHLLKAGDNERAWPLAVTAAESAERRAAPADAARLYRRALEAGRAAGAPERQLAGVWEQLGDVLRRAGMRTAAEAAWTTARQLLSDDPLGQARIYHRHARLADRTGRLSATVRWARRGLRALDGTEGDEAARWRVRLRVKVASARYAQNHLAEAIRLCRHVVDEAEQAGEELALAEALYLLDMALLGAGRAGEATHSARALAIYERLGAHEKVSSVVNNLGVMAYFEGRWDDAVRLYREGAARCERVGNVGGAAYGDCNIGEVLSDQGRYEEAAAALTRAQRTWRATDDVEGVAFASMFLGRLAVRRGQAAEGLVQLRAAAAEMARLGLGRDAALAEALVAEALTFAGDHGPGAAGSVEEALSIADRLEPTEGLTPLVRRVRAFALARAGAGAGVVAAELETALAAAREAGADYDTVLTLDALCHLGFTAHDVPDWERERAELFARLGVERLPVPPVPAAATADALSGAGSH